jgi:hypothetical protein
MRWPDLESSLSLTKITQDASGDGLVGMVVFFITGQREPQLVSSVPLSCACADRRKFGQLPSSADGAHTSSDEREART